MAGTDKYLYGLQIVVPGLAVCVCEFSMFVNAPNKQESLLVHGQAIYFFKEKYRYRQKKNVMFGKIRLA